MLYLLSRGTRNIVEKKQEQIGRSFQHDNNPRRHCCRHWCWSFIPTPNAGYDRADSGVRTGSGIGRDCAFAYAASGVAGVVFADIDISSAQKAASESQSFAIHPSYRAIALAVDVSQEDDMNSMIEKTVQEFGRIDYAVNSAGVSFHLTECSNLHICWWLRQRADRT